MSDNATDKTTGRTPWDFATVALMRLGPTTVVVVGFIGLSVFLYTEINKARFEADEQLRDSLASAEAQLVENTSKMGEMSEQLIDNISNMLELGERVDIKIEKVREEMTTSAEALKEAKRQVKEAQAKIGDLAAGLDRKLSELKDLRNERKQLTVEITQLRLEKEELEIRGSKYAQKVGELKEENVVLLSTEDFTLWEEKAADQGEGPEEGPLSLAEVIARVKKERTTISDVFPVFAMHPGSADTREKLGELIGSRESILEEVIRKDGAGFSTWFYFKNISTGAKSIFGYVEQEPDGPRGILKIRVQGGRISLVEPWAANVLFKIPTAENWYDIWTCDLFFDYENEIRNIYYDTKIDTWDAPKLALHAASDGKYETGTAYKTVVLYGELKEFETGSIEEFQKQFPKQYGQWRSQRNEAFGRPQLILSMLERAKTFDGTKITGMRSATFPDGLQDFAIEVLNASVSSDDAFLKSGVVGLEVTRQDLGGIAAMALREGLRVERVGQRQSAEQLAAAAEDFEILFSVEATDPAQERREARLTFSRAGERWKLSAFSAVF